MSAYCCIKLDLFINIKILVSLCMDVKISHIAGKDVRVFEKNILIYKGGNQR